MFLLAITSIVFIKLIPVIISEYTENKETAITNSKLKLKQIVDTINSKTPLMIDGSTRLEKVTTKPGSITYHLTLLELNLFDVDYF